MDAYVRRTEERALQALPAELREVTENCARRLGHELHASKSVWFTRSENPLGRGWLDRLFGRHANPADPNDVTDVALALTDAHLVIGIFGDASGPAALCAPRVEVRLDDSLPLRGVTIHGFASLDPVHDPVARGSFFLGVSADDAGDACLADLRRWVDEAGGGG